MILDSQVDKGTLMGRTFQGSEITFQVVLVLSHSFTPPPGDLPNPGTEPESSRSQRQKPALPVGKINSLP